MRENDGHFSVDSVGRTFSTASLERSMTWIAVLFDFKGEPPSARALDSPSFTPPLMGLAGEIRQRISSVWPGIDWTCDKCYYEAEDVSVLVKLSLDDATDNEPVDCVLLELGYSGCYSPYTALERICTRYGWSVFDAEIGQFLHFPAPDQSGRASVRRRAASVVRNLRQVKRRKRDDAAL